MITKLLCWLNLHRWLLVRAGPAGIRYRCVWCGEETVLK